MLDKTIRKFFKKVDPTKYVSEFVKRQRAISARPTMKLVWDSSPDKRGRGRTYIKAKHGLLAW